MKQLNARTLVWIAYSSLFLSLVWGVPGLLAALFVLKRIPKDLGGTEPNQKEKRDLRGAYFIARLGLVLSSLYCVVILWKLISTHIL
ncbi:MAG: hypothetical protein HQ472_01350 [Ignavibacteria bacterium]|nr:hypothetical protein [Ignavibacteria bacterium]